MRTVYKFELHPEVNQPVGMTVGAKILTVGNQDQRLVVWAEIDPDREPEERFFSVYGTGHTMPDDPGTYIGTAMFLNGNLVFHVYEDSPK